MNKCRKRACTGLGIILLKLGLGVGVGNQTLEEDTGEPC